VLQNLSKKGLFIHSLRVEPAQPDFVKKNGLRRLNPIAGKGGDCLGAIRDPNKIEFDAAQPEFRKNSILSRPFWFSRFNPKCQNPFVLTRLNPTLVKKPGLIKHKPVLNMVAANKIC